MFPPPLRVCALTKSFQPSLWMRYVRRAQPFTAVDGISFQLNSGEILGLLGPNGAGKTTTIQMLLDVLTPTSGAVEYFGMNVYKQRDVLARVAFASGYMRLPSSLTVRQCLIMHGMLYNMRLKQIHARIDQMLQEFSIEHLATRNAARLSAGQTTCVLLARAFLVEPQVLLLDEPTAALDPENARRVREIIATQNKQRGISVLFTSHNMAEVAELCDRILVLKNGVIIADDSPQYLAATVSRSRVQLFAPQDLDRLIAYAVEQKLVHTVQEKHIEIIVDEQNIAQLLAGIAARGLTYMQISVEKPTLEDYFVTIARAKNGGVRR